MEGSRSLSRVGIEKFKVNFCGKNIEQRISCNQLASLIKFYTIKHCNFYVSIEHLHFRFNATDDDIKRAYRKIVLKHHPDKRKAQGEKVNSDTDYFTCITKAYETLGKYQQSTQCARGKNVLNQMLTYFSKECAHI